MNTRKQVLIMSVLLMLMLIVVGIYGAWYPSRETDAEEHFNEQTAERGAILFARNCRLCHGDVGEGGSLGGRLAAAPALNRPDLQGFIDSEQTLAEDAAANAGEIVVDDAGRFSTGSIILIDEEKMEVTGIDGNTLRVSRGAEHTTAGGHLAGASILILDEAELDTTIDLITNTIACGRVGTAMPTWSQEQGGPLSDEQIRQLMIVITHGRWDLVKEEVDLEDRVTEVVAAADPESELIEVADASAFNEDEAIRIGEERLRVTGVQILDEGSGQGILTVERGILGTAPLPHSPGDVVYRFPEPAEPEIVQQACGQTARPAAPAGTPELIEDFEGQTVEVVAMGIAFDVDTITVSSTESEQVRVRLDNQDAGVDHNIAFYVSESDLTPVSEGSVGTIFPGPDQDDTVFDIPEPGEYYFQCDVHPSMNGDFIVE